MHIVQMAVVSFPIVWADFLKQHGLIGDLTEMRLVGCKGQQMQMAAVPDDPKLATIGVVVAGQPRPGLDGLNVAPSLPTCMQKGIRPLPAKVEGICKYTRPNMCS